jgi:hypothetical protein
MVWVWLFALWVFDGKRGDMGERNMENVKQGSGDTCVSERKIAVPILPISTNGN